MADHDDAHFLAYLKADREANVERGAWVHFDLCRWVAMTFLTSDPSGGAGISFYRHGRTGVESVFDLARLPREEQKLVMADSAELSLWQETCRIASSPNRLVIFDPRRMHQATNYFGEAIDDCRLTLNLYFGVQGGR